MATAAAKPRIHPARHTPDLTGSGVLRWMRACNRHEQEGCDATREVGQFLYRAVVASSRMPGGLDKRLAARRLRKAVVHAAVAQEEAATAFSAAQSIYLGLFGDPRSRANRAKRGFDPNK
jgi:hypothetical protein